MKTLSKNWLTEQHIDFEYKQYVLLAYLEDVSRQFDAKALYPSLADLIEHYRGLKSYQDNANQLYDSLRENIIGFDWSNFKLQYQKAVVNDALMNELNEIIAFSVEQFERYLKRGKEIYEHIEKHIHLEPVGLIPIDQSAGYMFLQTSSMSEIAVFEFESSKIELAGEWMRSIRVEYIYTTKQSLTNPPENIKTKLLSERPKLPNPATYLFTSELSIPMESAFLPIAKRSLIKEIAAKGM